jgi:hypothetical protein
MHVRVIHKIKKNFFFKFVVFIVAVVVIDDGMILFIFDMQT